MEKRKDQELQFDLKMESKEKVKNKHFSKLNNKNKDTNC